MFIRSKRLFLRPSWPEDWTELFSAINDEGVVRNLASAPWPYTMYDAMAFASRPQERLLPHFVATLPSAPGAKLIGSVGLGSHDGDVELGYWIGRRHQGQGYATEAASAVLELAGALGHRRVAAGHFADNPASGRVLAKLGFKRTGGQSLRYSLGRGEEAMSISYAVQLGAVFDCDENGYMRAA